MRKFKNAKQSKVVTLGLCASLVLCQPAAEAFAKTYITCPKGYCGYAYNDCTSTGFKCTTEALKKKIGDNYFYIYATNVKAHVYLYNERTNERYTQNYSKSRGVNSLYKATVKKNVSDISSVPLQILDCTSTHRIVKDDVKYTVTLN